MTFLREPNAEPIPGYRLIEPLGSGGFGEAWKCEAPGGILKACKFIFGNLNSLDSDSARAEQELGALHCVKEVRHPFVLSLDRFDQVEGELVCFMELADKNLHDLFEECIAAGMVGIPRADLLRYIRETAEALDHMQQKYNLLHLDIKPRNLFLISDHVKVADFGLVKRIGGEPGAATSVTPLYAPPETYKGDVSPNSDQYSLAIVYQEMLTGQRPFTGKNARQLMMQHMQAEPELRSLPEEERPVVARALAKDPAKRYPSCLAFTHALYAARRSLKPEMIVAPLADGQRPRSLAATADDILLEQLAESSSLAVSPPVEEEPATPIGMTQAQQNGALRPTLIVCVGGFGRRALLELRCRFLDRFGTLKKIPLLNFLYLDGDLEALKSALRGTQEMACAAEEVYHMPLQPIVNYRRRALNQLNEWLPQEKLYTIPRSLQTQGVRALGRLAFVDHHQRLLARIRRALQRIAHPDALYQSVQQTELALRDIRPRVYIIAAAGGGASGLLPDLGYGIRRMLLQLKQPHAEITTLLFCGAPEDPATPRSEQANIYATLTELHHFSEPSVSFTAQYSADAPRLVENDKPFQQIYLLKLANRTPESLRDAVAHLGSYLFHELTTPLGIRLEGKRRTAPPAEATRFRSFGTYGVWFPRGLLLRMAARGAGAKFLREWQLPNDGERNAAVEQTVAEALKDPELALDNVCRRIEESAAASFDGSLEAALTALLSAIEQQSLQAVAEDDPGNWANQTLAKVQEWLGDLKAALHGGELQRSQLSRSISAAIQKTAEAFEKRWCKAAFSLMDLPGRRLAAAEAALERFVQFCQQEYARHEPELTKEAQRLHELRDQLDRARHNCMTGQGGGFSLFGGKSRRLLRAFMEQLSAFSRQTLSRDLVYAGVQFYGTLRGRMHDRLRDISFCRQRLRNMQEALESPTGGDDAQVPSRYDVEMTPGQTPLPSAEAYWNHLRETETARVVLPQGETELDRASSQFLQSLTAEQWAHLEQSLQDQVLGPLGGVHHICETYSDLARSLAMPVLTHLVGVLGEFLPVTDVAQVEIATAEARQVSLGSQIEKYHARSAQLVAGANPAQQLAFLLVPASDSGKAFGEHAKEALSQLEVMRVPGQADLMFCREQGYLTPEDLRPVLNACRTAYTELSLTPNGSPHARFDVTDWVPVDL